jgi:hypothetical protein
MIRNGRHGHVQSRADKNHRPKRKCIGCGFKQEKFRLLRVVATKDDAVVWDKKQRLEGRGGYLCPRQECFELAVKRRGFQKAFRRNVEVNEGLRLEVGSYLYAKSQSV